MKKRQYFALPYLYWMAVFAIVPIFMLVRYAAFDETGHMTAEYFAEALSAVHFRSFLLSLFLALSCTLICLLLAYPLSLILKSLKINETGVLIMIVIAPMWMNYVLRIMSWQLLLSKNGVINVILGFLGLPPQNLGNSAAAIVIGMVYDYLPFMLLPVYHTILSIDNRLIEAAHDLGAGRLAVFSRVVWPLSRPGVISGVIMVFIPSLTTFAISDMLGGGKVMLIGNIIEQEFVTSMNWHTGSALSLLLLVFTIPGLFLQK